MAVRLLALRCDNPLCPHYLQTGTRRFLGEAAAESLVRLRCRDCRVYQVYRVEKTTEGARQPRAVG